MPLHCARAEEQLAADFGIRISLLDEGDDLALLSGELNDGSDGRVTTSPVA
jgi:hypothetical protein